MCFNFLCHLINIKQVYGERFLIGSTMQRMENSRCIVEPFGTLEDLYKNFHSLKPWPESEKLRESTEYVYAGSHLEDNTSGNLVRLDRDGQPRTIICHDMKGGYLEDRFIDGSTASDSYTFYHWSIIDVFIYFSHHMVTIPPLGWINAAHKHGVKVLGTLITESQNGEKIWNKVLSSLEETKKLADSLITLAKFYNFEGWLLNVENKIKQENVEKLVFFVKYLSDGIHREIRESQVIWYDSVTVDGDLTWQNQLNHKNQAFFDNCDGIFLNYNWNDEGLESSREIAAKNSRIRDIYVGLDVWGRGCPGGGGFNSIHALERIRKFDLSVAIFAPGWTHENFGPSTFEMIENTFWAQLVPFLYIHVPIYEDEEFETSFCRGYGENLYRCGVMLDPGRSFFNLTWQKPQVSVPSLHLKFTHKHIPQAALESDPKRKEGAECTFENSFQTIKIQGKKISFFPKNSHVNSNRTEFCDKLSYDGGGCLQLITADTQIYHRLFLVHLEFPKDIQVILIYRESEETASNNINQRKAPTLVLINANTSNFLQANETLHLDTRWKQSYYTTNLRTIIEIGVAFSSGGRYCLGQLQVKPLHRFLNQF